MSKKYLKLGQILKKLLFENDMKAVDLAREVNMPPPTIHRLITGKSTRPYKSSLKPIADYFSITLDQLVGEHVLREPTSKSTYQSGNQSIFHIPLLPWSDLISLELVSKLTYNSIPFTGLISEHSFATTMNDSSMEPLFNKGTTLIFDPDRLAQDRGYILVHLHESNVIIFRQLLIDVENKYLKPLNPDLNNFQMKMLNKEDKIIGTLIEARQVYIDH